jgi:hypothetical protein
MSTATHCIVSDVRYHTHDILVGESYKIHELRTRVWFRAMPAKLTSAAGASERVRRRSGRLPRHPAGWMRMERAGKSYQLLRNSLPAGVSAVEGECSVQQCRVQGTSRAAARVLYWLHPHILLLKGLSEKGLEGT